MSGYHVISRSDKYLAGVILFLRGVAIYQNNDGDMDIGNVCDSTIYSLPCIVSSILNTQPVSNTNL